MFEIFVYSPRFEGVHLRGGKVARGGLRWSDRPEDFRTEVLGLVKAQMVKNIVIVPVGSKGGFVLKRAPAADRPRRVHEGRRRLLPGLPARAARPHRQPRRRQDRAAAAGAAARRRRPVPRRRGGQGHGDVLRLRERASARSTASGSATRSPPAARSGYDHKAMGITARGAWESVKRHFREMGVDTQTTDFTVAGIGDMSGDVFGNGMLLSRHIRLVAAFDHRHIFLDPNPDAASSFAERERLFKLPRSSWADYDAKLDLAGRRRPCRAARSRSPITPEARRRSAIDADAADADRARQRDPQGAGRPPLQRRHRHLREGAARDARRRSATARTTRCASTARAALQGRRRGRQPRLHAARAHRVRAGGRTHLHRRDRQLGRASTPPTTRSTSRSCSAWRSPTASSPRSSATRCSREMTDDVAALVLRDNYFQTQALSVTGRIAPAAARRAGSASCSSWRRAAGSTARSSSCPPTRRSPSARAGKLGLDRTRARGAARVLQDVARTTSSSPRRCPTIRGSRPRSARYFPQALREALRRRTCRAIR